MIKDPPTCCPSCGGDLLGHASGSCLDAFTILHLYWTNDIWRFLEAIGYFYLWTPWDLLNADCDGLDLIPTVKSLFPLFNVNWESLVSEKQPRKTVTGVWQGDLPQGVFLPHDCVFIGRNIDKHIRSVQ